jgi:hypothetical protein
MGGAPAGGAASTKRGKGKAETGSLACLAALFFFGFSASPLLFLNLLFSS